MDVAWSGGALLTALVSGGAFLTSLRRWRGARDERALPGVLAALNLALIAGAAALLLAPFDAIRSGALPMAASLAWVALLTWWATRVVVARRGAAWRVLLLGVALGAACGWLALLGIGVAESISRGTPVLVFLLIAGSLPAALAGATVGLVLGAVDAAVLPRLSRGPR